MTRNDSNNVMDEKNTTGSNNVSSKESSMTTTTTTTTPSPPPLETGRLQRRRSTKLFPDDPYDDDAFVEGMSGVFRGIAAATRKAALVAKRAVIAKGGGMGGADAAKQAIRAVGENRPLAFASEGAVAGDALIPRWVYYGAWGLSGVAIAADVYNRYDDAPEQLKANTALYWTAFHIPASLLVPAAIIHQIVHFTERTVKNTKMEMIKNLPPRSKAMVPVAAAIISIIPVVPAVDYTAEAILEPTLGSYLGLEFHHHHHHHHHHDHNVSDESGSGKETPS